MSAVIATAFVAAICAAALHGSLPVAAAAAYIIASLAAMIVYAIDKSAAQRNAWRISEGTLHLLALVGGWPGALIAQRFFHHKTRKISFQVAFWATVVVNCAALAWYWSARP